MPDRLYPGLLQGGWQGLDYVPFRDGVTVHWLAQGKGDDPSAAILIYAAGARIPRHRHAGLEAIVVLDGVQSDESGDYPAGSLVLNPTGSEHSVWTEAGCVVFIQWDHPVIFVDQEHAH